MGLFGASSPFDQVVEKATSEMNSAENWGLIMEICDGVSASPTGPKDCLRSVMKRLNHKVPIVQIQALALLDACVQNCGKSFQREVASKDFTTEVRSIIKQSNSKVVEKFKEVLKKWSQNEFKSDPALSVIPTFYKSDFVDGDELTKSALSYGSSASTATAKEQEDLQKAIALSMKDTSSKSGTLYPSMPSTQPAASNKKESKEARKVRALYDFEAAEDNELTFKTGEIIVVTDDSDANWWKGSTWRGEGLFPASFVSSDLNASVEEIKPETKKVQFNETVAVKQFDPETVQIDENKIDQALNMIQNADPTGEYEDSSEMVDLEAQCKAMVPLIDQELQRIDRKYNELAELNQRLTESFQLYNSLMQEAAAAVPQQPYGVYASLPYTAGTSMAAKGFMTNMGYAPHMQFGPQPVGLPTMPGVIGSSSVPAAGSSVQQSQPVPFTGMLSSQQQQQQQQPAAMPNVTQAPYAPLTSGAGYAGPPGAAQSQYVSSQPYATNMQAFPLPSAANSHQQYVGGSAVVYGMQQPVITSSGGFGQLTVTPAQQQLY